MSPTNTFISKLEKAFDVLKPLAVFGSFAEFQSVMSKIGGTDDESLRLASFEDLEGIGVPKLKAKQIANIFRAKDTASDADEQDAALMIHKPISDWPVELLLKKANPNKPYSSEMIELKKRFGDKSVIAFNDDDTFNLDVTLKVIERIQEGFTIDLAMYANKRIYKVGEGPWRIKDACPLHPDIPLIDGRCHKCQQTWSKLSKTLRRVVYFIGKRKLVDVSSRPQVIELFKMASTSDANTPDAVLANETLCNTYPEALHDYNDAKKRDELPGLTVDIGADENGGGNPFGKSRKF